MNIYNSTTSFATHSMTHAPAQRSAVIDFASVSRVATRLENMTTITPGEYDDNEEINAILHQLRPYMTAVQARLKQWHPQPIESWWTQVTLTDYATAIMSIGGLEYPRIADVLAREAQVVEMSMAWVQSNWQIHIPELLPLSSSPGGFNMRTRLGRWNCSILLHVSDYRFAMIPDVTRFRPPGPRSDVTRFSPPGPPGPGPDVGLFSPPGPAGSQLRVYQGGSYVSSGPRAA